MWANQHTVAIENDPFRSLIYPLKMAIVHSDGLTIQTAGDITILNGSLSIKWRPESHFIEATDIHFVQ